MAQTPNAIRLTGPDQTTARRDLMEKTGKVFLIGAGPGDPDLLTVKALRCLQSAEVVIYDRLVSDEIMELVPKDAVLVPVGKAPKHHMVPQEGINELLVEHAHKATTIVRLKGGDPFIFGRGSEEAQRLVEAGIPFEVVPGITAAQGCSTSLHVPLTHRGMATGVRYVTGHCRNDVPLDLNWSSLADEATTLVVYMGLAAIEQISRELIANGMRADIPVLAISKGTTKDERHVLADLRSIHQVAKQAELKAPTLFIIGEVASFTGQLHVDEGTPIATPAKEAAHG
ncbi:uroporphyrin-III C-methyltransferase / precorrin-2 dehydrogenase / sirohydrochlorin ferrochelatase/uroporphyrin-III C-methyltransferase [Cohaesibacter gelatinilyticus]|uniref:uroporphyrinogen-III C-methyltransferase n=2 Tax=Cohaesibacter gelatinilyticus TaxID=372072 RepID=A0A285NCL7_9HYPH|nr:uroporphyrin-III C-methyltransferase / precorrin-2 dehydrogenase / sirohydrochlorin ferrochelatase/uroporphyrin-III C-methyltransferase [Cohaesibacter gelatinilyticus]